MTPDDVLTWLHSQEKRPTRVQMAERYRDLLIQHWNNWTAWDSRPLNAAIEKRWSAAGLIWIKKAAWRAAEGTVRIHARSAR